MLHKFSAWTYQSNFGQSLHKNWTKSVTNAWSWWEKSKATVFPACNSWLNFCVWGQFEINILIVRQKYTTYFTWTSHDTIKWYRSADTLSCNWSQHWCPICVHYQFSCALKLSRKYENEHWSWSSETMNSSADSFQLDELTREPPIWSYDSGQWLSCFDSCQLSILWISNIQDVDLQRHAWHTPPSLLIVSTTPPLQFVDAYVRTYVRSITWQPNEQRLTIFYEYGARSTRGSPANALLLYKSTSLDCSPNRVDYFY